MSDSLNDMEVLSLVYLIHHQMRYRDPPFSISNIMERLYPDVGVVGIEMDPHGRVEIYEAPVHGRRAMIFYNENDHHSTQRFSIAHELAHVEFDGLTADECGRRTLPERRANFFAAQLLCPLWILDQHVTFTIYPSHDDDDGKHRFKQNAQRLASRFNLSLACMKRRIYDLAAWRKISSLSRR